MRVQGFRVTIHSLRIERTHDRLVILGGGQTFEYHGFHTPRTLSNGQRGVALLAIDANRFEIRFTSDRSVTDEGFELSYAPYLGAVPYRTVFYTFMSLTLVCSLHVKLPLSPLLQRTRRRLSAPRALPTGRASALTWT